MISIRRMKLSHHEPPTVLTFPWRGLGHSVRVMELAGCGKKLVQTCGLHNWQREDGGDALPDQALSELLAPIVPQLCRVRDRMQDEPIGCGGNKDPHALASKSWSRRTNGIGSRLSEDSGSATAYLV